MFPITVTLHTAGQLQAVISALNAEAASPADSPKTGTSAVSAKEKTEVLSAGQQAAVDDTAGLEPVGNAQGARTASSARTATEEAAAAQDKKPATQASSASTAPDAGASSVPTDKPVTYADLQAAVLALHKLDATAAKPIAEAMGFANFKAMPEDKWAEALGKVQEVLSAKGVV